MTFTIFQKRLVMNYVFFVIHLNVYPFTGIFKLPVLVSSSKCYNLLPGKLLVVNVTYTRLPTLN